MSKKEDGGSDSGNGVAQAPPAGDGTTNKTAKMSTDQVRAQNVELTQKVKEKDAMIMDLTKQLKEANDVLEGQERERLIGEILPRSNFKADELAAKTVEQLNDIRTTLDQAMLPKVNSVRMGVSGLGLSDRQKGLTVGDQSYATKMRRKAEQETG